MPTLQAFDRAAWAQSRADAVNRLLAGGARVIDGRLTLGEYVALEAS